MRKQAVVTERPAARKRRKAPAGEDQERAAARARAECAEIPMLAAAKGWGKKRIP